MSVNERIPALAIVVKVIEAFMHCAKAFRRSQLWNPDRFQDRRECPRSRRSSSIRRPVPHDDDEMQKIDDDLEVEYKRTLY